MSAASDALNAARTALQVAARPNSSVEDRRAFISRLLALPREPSLDAKSFFVTLLPKYFAEFADLQDEQIDGLLDICEHEEEQVRIIGIKGLATVAKADKNWAKSNTNVLLQLLECPPSELKVVKQTLLNLLSSAPNETLSVLLDDIVSSEGATGIPRLNILKFLLNDAEEWRKESLHYGRKVDLEKDFFDGLVKIVDDIPLKETRIIIDMISDLYIITGTGRDTDPKRLDRFIRALTTSLEADSSVNTSMAHINTFARVSKRAKVDGRSALAFLARHGGAVVELALVKKDKVAEGVLEKMYEWVKDAERGWTVDKDKDEDKVVRAVVDTVLDEVLRCTRDMKARELEKQSQLLERVLWPIYDLVAERSRRDLIRSSIISKLNALDDTANSAYKDEGKKSVLGRRLRNIRDIADYLSDDKASRLDSHPTWLEPAPSARPSATAQAVAPAAHAPTSRPPAQRIQPVPPNRQTPYSRPSVSARTPAPVAPVGPASRPSTSRPEIPMQRAVPPHLAPSGPSRATQSVHPRSPSPDRRSGRDLRDVGRQDPGRGDEREQTSNRADVNGHRDDSYGPREASPMRPAAQPRGAQSTSARSPRRDRTLSPRKRSSSPAPHALTLPLAQRVIAREAQDTRPSAVVPEIHASTSRPPSGSSRGLELLASKVGVEANGSSRGVELLGPPSNAVEAEAGSSRGKELLQPKLGVPTAAQPSAAASAMEVKPRPGPPQSIHSSLSIRNFANAATKRSREEASPAYKTDPAPAPSKGATTSLLSRLSRPPSQEQSSAEAGHAAKRARPSTEAALPPRPADEASGAAGQGRASLLSRLGSSTPAHTSPSPSPAPAASTPALTIRARASAPVDTPPKAAFSVLGRSSATPIPTDTEGTTRGTSAPVATGVTSAPTSSTSDGPVRRKGRGFNAPELSEIVVQPETHRIPAWNPTPSPKLPITPDAHAPTPPKSLQARLQPVRTSSGGGESGQITAQGARSLAQRLGM